MKRTWRPSFTRGSVRLRPQECKCVPPSACRLLRPVARPVLRVVRRDARTVSMRSVGPLGARNRCERHPRNDESPHKQGFRKERMKGLEPSTFCMASGRTVRARGRLLPAYRRVLAESGCAIHRKESPLFPLVSTGFS
jgi:hypothetical protein